jgi:hypothetical protein
MIPVLTRATALSSQVPNARPRTEEDPAAMAGQPTRELCLETVPHTQEVVVKSCNIQNAIAAHGAGMSLRLGNHEETGRQARP